MKQFLLLPLFLAIVCTTAMAKNKWTLVVEAGNYDRTDCVVSADLTDRLNADATYVTLYELEGKKKKKELCQLVKGKDGSAILYFVLSGKTPAGTKRTYVVEQTAKNKPSTPVMQTEDTGKALLLKKNGTAVMQYNYAHTNPPGGVDPAYGRSGYIHPAYSPAGHILTTIQPRDHYHHYGIWNPWTRIEYEGKVYDLWNLGDKQGTVKARDIKEIYQGDIFTGYRAGLDHVAFTPSGKEVIMDELWDVKAWNNGNAFLWDFDSYLEPVTSSPLTLKEYRYAGFSWRATEEWTRQNCEMMTSEGKTRQQIDGSTARWIYTTGQCGNDRAGILFMSHPQNYNSPEPLRIWDENANGGRGDAFMNFAPTKNTDWKLNPGNEYKLRYRVLTYDGEMTAERANSLWNDFAYPPVVKIKQK